MPVLSACRRLAAGCGAAMLAMPGIGTGPALAQTAPSATAGWTFAVTPYLWLPSIDGEFRYRGSSAAGATDVDVGSSGLLDALRFAAMIAAEARNGRFTVLTDFIYLDFRDEGGSVASAQAGGRGGTVSAALGSSSESRLDGSLWSLAGGYTLLDGGWGHLDATAGFRLLSIRARSDVVLGASLSGAGGSASAARMARLERSEDLLDAVVGGRGRLILGSGFHIPYAFDIGTGSSRITWQASAALGYQTGWAGVSLGYRHLYYDQGGDGLLQGFSFSGPFIAANFSF